MILRQSSIRTLIEVDNERARQDRIHGEQNHRDLGIVAQPRDFERTAENWYDVNAQRFEGNRLAWDGILLEEVYGSLSAPDTDDLRAGLIKVAALAVAWVEAIDRREVTP